MAAPSRPALTQATFRTLCFPVEATPPLDPHSLALTAVFDGPHALSEAVRLMRRLERGHGLLEHPRLGPVQARVRTCTLCRRAEARQRAEVRIDFVSQRCIARSQVRHKPDLTQS